MTTHHPSNLDRTTTETVNRVTRNTHGTWTTTKARHVVGGHAEGVL